MNDRSPPSGVGGWPDIVAFGGAFVIGVVGYFLMRALDASQAWITATLIGFMLVYAATLGWVPRLRLRRDQAADNTYYLGLLFTLMSMAFALYDFGVIQTNVSAVPAARDEVSQIIANFGIALATTIAGIFLRIMLQQMRLDPSEVEAASRLEFAEAAGRVRATLSAVSTDMGLLLQEMRQRAADHHKTFVDDAQRLLRDGQTTVAAFMGDAANSIAHTQQLAIEAIAQPTRELGALAEATAEATARVRAVEPPPLEFASRLERASASLETLVETTGRVEHALSSVAEMSARLQSEIQKSASGLLRTLSAAAEAREAAWRGVDAGSRHLGDALDAIGTKLDADRQAWVDLQDKALAASKTAVELEEAAHRVMETLTGVARTVTASLNGQPSSVGTP